MLTPLNSILTPLGRGRPLVNGASDITNGLVGWWQFSETSGTTAADSSGNGNDGAVNGAMWGGGALTFNGSTDYVSLGDKAAFKQTSLTLCAWVKRTVNHTGNRAVLALISGTTGYEVACSGSAGYNFWWATTKNFAVNSTSFNIPLNSWCHLALAYDETSGATAYANGSSVFANSTTGALLYGLTYDLRIGDRSDQSGWKFPGVLDDVRIYNRALSSTEISTLYANGAK